MIDQTTLKLLREDDGEQIHIFVPGYSTSENPRHIDRIGKAVGNIPLPGRAYLLLWPAGNWRTPFLASKTLLLLRGPLLTRVPAALAANIVLQIASFKLCERRAEAVGRDLHSIIASIPGIEGATVSLVGHSLGARIIQSALGVDWRGYRIQDCVFLGGAADAELDDWDQRVSRITGRLYNAYSERDFALAFTPDLRKRAGRHPIRTARSQIVNRHFPSLNHMDYWRILPDIFRELRHDCERTSST